MADPKVDVSEVAKSVQDIFSIKEHLVDKDLQQLELRLNSRIDEVKDDLKKDIAQVKIDLQKELQSRDSSLKWFIGLFVTGGVAVTGIIVTLVVALIK